MFTYRFTTRTVEGVCRVGALLCKARLDNRREGYAGDALRNFYRRSRVCDHSGPRWRYAWRFGSIPIMKTPTLIVRLAGIYLLVNAFFALFSLTQVPVPDGGAMKYSCAFGAFPGLIVTRYAGWFAGILTFDAVDAPADGSDRAGEEDV